MRFARLGTVGAEIPVVLDGDRTLRPAIDQRPTSTARS